MSVSEQKRTLHWCAALLYSEFHGACCASACHFWKGEEEYTYRKWETDNIIIVLPYIGSQEYRSQSGHTYQQIPTIYKGRTFPQRLRQAPLFF